MKSPRVLANLGESHQEESNPFGTSSGEASDATLYWIHVGLLQPGLEVADPKVRVQNLAHGLRARDQVRE